MYFFYFIACFTVIVCAAQRSTKWELSLDEFQKAYLLLQPLSLSQLVKELLEFHVPVKYIEKSEPDKDSSVDGLAGDQSEDSCQPHKKLKLCDSTPSTAINTPPVGQLQHEPASSEDIPAGANRISCESTQCSHCEAEMQIDVKNMARPSYDPSKMTFDASCAGCRERYRDPTVEELTMYLHALRYEVHPFDDTKHVRTKLL